jgi:hypothetical protein
MTKSAKPLSLRQSGDGGWEVENIPGNWIKCKNEEDAKILSNYPIVLKESFKVLLPNEEVAEKLDRTAEKMEQYNMSVGARYLRARAEKAKGKDS